jgi:hypothetical protein
LSLGSPSGVVTGEHLAQPRPTTSRGLAAACYLEVLEQVWEVFGLIKRPQTHRTGKEPVFSLVVTFTGIRMVRAISTSWVGSLRVQCWVGAASTAIVSGLEWGPCRCAWYSSARVLPWRLLGQNSCPPCGVHQPHVVGLWITTPLKLRPCQSRNVRFLGFQGDNRSISAIIDV